MNTRRFIATTYAVLFVLVGLVSGVFFFRTYQEFTELRRLEEESRRRLTLAEERLAAQARELERLRTDPAYVEKVIREQLRYAKPHELLFRFEENAPPVVK